MFKITSYYKGDMLFESKLGNHRLVVDVPPDMGGKDRAPTPPLLFVASLGTCVAAFVAQYCERSAIDARDMTVDVTFDKVEDPARLVNLKVTVNLPYGECSESRKKAILRVAKHCPVHETIATSDGIDIMLVARS